MLGYIPVSPATSNMYGPSQYSTIKVKTLFIFGSKDKNLGKRGSESFRYVPDIEIFEIQGGTHSCYIDYPDVFNHKILSFIDSLISSKIQNAENKTTSSWRGLNRKKKSKNWSMKAVKWSIDADKSQNSMLCQDSLVLAWNKWTFSPQPNVLKSKNKRT